MKQRLVLFIVFGILGVSCDPSNSAEFIVSGDLLPLGAGNMWSYDETAAGREPAETRSVTVTLFDPVTIDGIAWYGVNDFCVEKGTGSPLPLSCAAWGRKGDQVLFNRRGPGPARLDYEVILDLPLLSGKSWLTRPSVDTSYVTIGGDTVIMKNASRRTVSGIATVSVPAGMFMSCAVVVDTTTAVYEYRPANDSILVARSYTQMRTTEWYAKDVGLVKQIVETSYRLGALPLTTETRVLTKYTVKGL